MSPVAKFEQLFVFRCALAHVRCLNGSASGDKFIINVRNRDDAEPPWLSSALGAVKTKSDFFFDAVGAYDRINTSLSAGHECWLRGVNSFEKDKQLNESRGSFDIAVTRNSRSTMKLPTRSKDCSSSCALNACLDI